jgi:hypothetical protein
MNKEIKVWDEWQNPLEVQAYSSFEVTAITETEVWILKTVDENGITWETTFMGSKMTSSVQI